MPDAYVNQMTCDDVRNALAEGAELTPELRAHADVCEACAALSSGSGDLARLLADERVSDLPSPSFDALTSRLEAEKGPIQTLSAASTPVRLALAFAASLLIFATILVVTRRPDLAVYPVPRMALALGAIGIALGVAFFIALRPLQKPALSESRLRLSLGAFVAACFALSALPAAHFDHPASLAGAGDDLVPRAAACFFFGIAIGAPLYLLLRWLDRGRHRAFWPVVTSVAAAALAGNFALQLHCPITHPVHLLAGHASVIGASVALALATWRFLGGRQAA